MCVCVFQIRVWPITSLCMVGLKNNLAHMIIKTRQYVACKNHVAMSKVKVTVGTYSFCVLKLCPTHNFIMHGGIWKLCGTTNHTDKMECHMLKPCCLVKGQGHSWHLKFLGCINVSDHNFIMHGGIWKYFWQKWSSWQDGMSGVRTRSLGQRSRSHLALKVFGFYNRVQSITSSCMVGF